MDILNNEIEATRLKHVIDTNLFGKPVLDASLSTK